MFKYVWIAAFAVFIGLFGMVNSANAAEVYTSKLSNKAVGGYDTVSYFQGDGVPVKGSKDFAADYKGAEWLFSSQGNLDLFKADPAKYAPQYGGHCAWAASQGNLAKGDPMVYTVHNGKLYLNYNRDINKKWVQDKDGFIELADEKYPALIE